MVAMRWLVIVGAQGPARILTRPIHYGAGQPLDQSALLDCRQVLQAVDGQAPSLAAVYRDPAELIHTRNTANLTDCSKRGSTVVNRQGDEESRGTGGCGLVVRECFSANRRVSTTSRDDFDCTEHTVDGRLRYSPSSPNRFLAKVQYRGWPIRHDIGTH